MSLVGASATVCYSKEENKYSDLAYKLVTNKTEAQKFILDMVNKNNIVYNLIYFTSSLT